MFRMLNKNEKHYKKPHIIINSQSENIAVFIIYLQPATAFQKNTC